MLGLVAGSSAGCGGGAALMHPAHTLAAERVSVGAGVSHQLVFGDAEQAITDSANASPHGGTSSDRDAAYARGGLAAALLAPGSSPWVGGRVGLGSDFEAGVTYTGRTARVDARHAFEGESLAVSIGLGASGKLGHSAENDSKVATSTDVPGLDESATRGFGFDVPVLVGWRSSSDVLQAWFGLRGGYERIGGDVLVQFPSGVAMEDLQGKRWFAGGLFGLMVGISPVWVALELDASFQKGNGTISPRSVMAGELPEGRGVDQEGRFEGVTLAPTGALVTRF